MRSIFGLLVVGALALPAYGQSDFLFATGPAPVEADCPGGVCPVPQQSPTISQPRSAAAVVGAACAACPATMSTAPRRVVYRGRVFSRRVFRGRLFRGRVFRGRLFGCCR